MVELFQGVSQNEGPLWKWNYSGLTFDVPFTSPYQRIELGPWAPAALSWVSAILFCFLVIVVFPMIKPKSKETIKTIAFWHYCGLFIYSAVCSAAAFYVMFSRGEVDFNNLTPFYCDKVPDWFRIISVSFIFSKYWEWVDTALLVWNGKSVYQIGFLHFYHHMTTVWVFSLTSNFPGTDKLGIALNGFVHTLMYYHYAFRLPKMFRPLITFAQIVQLAIGTLSWGYNYEACSEYAGMRENSPLSYWSLWAMVPVFLVFFIRFFFQTYILPQPPQQKPQVVEKKQD
eukprot:UN01755